MKYKVRFGLSVLALMALVVMTATVTFRASAQEEMQVLPSTEETQAGPVELLSAQGINPMTDYGWGGTIIMTYPDTYGANYWSFSVWNHHDLTTNSFSDDGTNWTATYTLPGYGGSQTGTVYFYLNTNLTSWQSVLSASIIKLTAIEYDPYAGTNLYALDSYQPGGSPGVTQFKYTVKLNGGDGYVPSWLSPN